jgi:hypothetical protein
MTYKLSVSLPDAPLARFRAQTAGLPQTTEVERLVVQRIGQDIFRVALMDYWRARCPITGITDPALLRASHIVPWAECDDRGDLRRHRSVYLPWPPPASRSRLTGAFLRTGIATPPRPPGRASSRSLCCSAKERDYSGLRTVDGAGRYTLTSP